MSWSWRDLAKHRLHPTICLHLQAVKWCPLTHLELNVEQSKGARASFQSSSPLGLQLVLFIVNSDKNWDLVKSSDKKVQKKGYKYPSESQVGDQGQFYEKIILESKKW